jgi:predicted secreted Zn-dependent protease
MRLREGTKTSSSRNGQTHNFATYQHRKGGAFRIMHQQFRRAIGCATVRGQAKLTLGRLHYVRATREEAASVCKHIIATIGGHQASGADHHGSTTTRRRDIQLLSNFGMAITTPTLVGLG